ncbi:hypothetical protein [Streptomyces canus]|uniref:hypothetical protein n=1 Tax=Streptomyces canus TaxID=58343 RepID=UPI0037F846FE
MARAHARYTTAGGRTVTVAADLPGLRNGFQCDGCYDQTDAATDLTDMDRRGRTHADRCTSKRPHRPTYWGLI